MSQGSLRESERRIEMSIYQALQLNASGSKNLICSSSCPCLSHRYERITRYPCRTPLLLLFRPAKTFYTAHSYFRQIQKEEISLLSYMRSNISCTTSDNFSGFSTIIIWQALLINMNSILSNASSVKFKS